MQSVHKFLDPVRFSNKVGQDLFGKCGARRYSLRIVAAAEDDFHVWLYASEFSENFLAGHSGQSQIQQHDVNILRMVTEKIHGNMSILSDDHNEAAFLKQLGDR
jgi:hypothetical protein